MCFRGPERVRQQQANDNQGKRKLPKGCIEILRCPESWWRRSLPPTSAALSKHLKGHLDHPVGDVMFFGSKGVSWILLLVTSRFCNKGGQMDPPDSDVTFFGSKEVTTNFSRVASVCLQRFIFTNFDMKGAFGNSFFSLPKCKVVFVRWYPTCNVVPYKKNISKK